jgi:hypothetical protein
MANKVHLARMEQLVIAEQLAQKARRVKLGQQENKVSRVSRASRATRALKAQRVILVLRALVEWQAKMAQLDQGVYKEKMVKQALMAQQAKMAQMVQLDKLVPEV